MYEQDWQKFDGFTPTFAHPNLSAGELQFLLGAAYARFYMRPSGSGCTFACLAIGPVITCRAWTIACRHEARAEIAVISRAVEW